MKQNLTATRMAALMALALSSAYAADEKPVPTLTPEEVKLTANHDILPLPGEVLNVLKSLKPADWAAAASTAESAPAGSEKADSAQTAARLGIRTADCFLAIKAQSSALLEKASADVLAAANKLGATKAVVANAEEIRTKGAGGKWAEITPLLDATYNDARKAMNELGDTDSAAIAAAAGWVRGIDIFAGELSTKYDAAASKALRQGSLVTNLLGKLEAVSAAAKAKPGVKNLIESLTAIKPLVTFGMDATVDQKTVQQIAAAAKAAVAAQN